MKYHITLTVNLAYSRIGDLEVEADSIAEAKKCAIQKMRDQLGGISQHISNIEFNSINELSLHKYRIVYRKNNRQYVGEIYAHSEGEAWSIAYDDEPEDCDDIECKLVE